MAAGWRLKRSQIDFGKGGVAPAQEALAWLPLLRRVLQTLAAQPGVSLLLWGKVAEKIQQLPEARHFHCLLCEHPYNLSFIANPHMLRLFAPMKLLQQKPEHSSGH